MKTNFHMDQDFAGIDAFHSVYDLPPGYCKQIDNLYFDGKELITRPGRRALLAAPMPGPNYAPLAYVDAGGRSGVVFTSGGKLYHLAQPAPGSAASATEVRQASSASFALDSGAAQFVRAGACGYGVDGAGPLIRFDLSDSTQNGFVQNLTAPTTAPTVALADTTLDPCHAPGLWAGQPAASPASLLQNGSFETVTVLNSAEDHYAATGWSTQGLNPDCRTGASGTTPRTGTYCLLLDTPGDTYYQTVPAAALSQPTGLPQTARAYVFQGWMHQADSAGTDTIIVSVQALDAGGDILAEQQTTLTQPYDAGAGDWTQHTFIASFTALPEDPASVSLILQAGPGNHAGDGSTFLDDVALYPLDVTLVTASKGADQIVASCKGTAIPLLTGYDWAVGGQTLAVSYAGAPKNFAANTYALGIALPPGVSASSPPAFRFGFLQSGGSQVFWTNDCQYSADGTYLYADVTTVPAAALASCAAFYVQIEDDLPVANYPFAFAFGPLTEAGNLSIGYAPYNWVATEVVNLPVSGQPRYANAVESDPSPISTALSPTGLEAEAAITPAASVNASATDLYVYRYGGTFSDGLARLVAQVQKGVASRDTANGYWSWDGLTLTDNTPDSALNYATTLSVGRGSPPAGCQALAYWQGRLWVADGSDIYGSWLMAAQPTNQSALYFNLINVENDPNAAVKGVYFSAGGPDNDPVTAMVPLGTMLVILKQRSVWVLSGYDPTSFVLQSYLINAGVGCLAPNTARVVGNQVWFLGPDDLYAFNGDVVTPVSTLIEKGLNPSETGEGTPLSPAAYAASAGLYHARRYHLFCPASASDTANTVDYVLDTRNNGWTRWLSGTATPWNVTGGASLSAGADTDELWMTGGDGQIYLYDSATASDTAVWGGGPLPIPWAATGRGTGLELSGPDYWREDRASRLYALLWCQEPSAATATVNVGIALPTRTWSTTWLCNTAGLTATPPPTQVRVKPPADVRGSWMAVTVSGSTLAPFRLSSWGIEVAEGRLDAR